MNIYLDLSGVYQIEEMSQSNIESDRHIYRIHLCIWFFYEYWYHTYLVECTHKHNQSKIWYPILNTIWIHTVGGKKDWTKRDFRSKTTPIAGGVYGTWVNPRYFRGLVFFEFKFSKLDNIHYHIFVALNILSAFIFLNEILTYITLFYSFY